MDDKQLKEIHQAMMFAQSDALALVVSALARQLDPVRLASDVRGALSSAKMLGQISPIAERIATDSLAAIDAEVLLRKQDRDQGKH